MDKFNLLQTKVQWDEIALMSQFKEGLKPDVIRFGGTMGWPRELEELKQAAVRIDESLMSARIHERRQQPTLRPPQRNWPPRQVQAAAAEHQAEQPRNEANAGSFRPPFAKLTMEEKQQRRKEGLCLRCGKPGHFAVNCKKTQGNIATLEDTTKDTTDPFSGKGPSQ